MMKAALYCVFGVLALAVSGPAERAGIPPAEEPADPAAYDWQEWGVWLVRQDGEGEKFVDAGRMEELPPFVTPLSHPVPDFFSDPDLQGRPDVEFRKPVAWVFPREGSEGWTLSVRIEAAPLLGGRILGGAAWPPAETERRQERLAQRTPLQTVETLCWNALKVGAEGGLPVVLEAGGLGGPTGSHWWNRLREVPGAARLEDDAGHREQFLFYKISMNGRSLWHVIKAQGPRSTQFTFHEVDGVPHFRRTGPGREPADFAMTWENLRAQILVVCRELGLREAVAAALADVWEPEFRAMPAGSVWTFLGTEAYDATFPLAAHPAPATTSRVGLLVMYPPEPGSGE